MPDCEFPYTPSNSHSFSIRDSISIDLKRNSSTAAAAAATGSTVPAIQFSLGDTSITPEQTYTYTQYGFQGLSVSAAAATVRNSGAIRSVRPTGTAGAHRC